MRKKTLKLKLAALLACCLAAAFICVQMTDEAYAYFNRGTVTMTLGKSSVSLTEGSSENISITFSPASDDQTPSCGMAECPQICGDKECLDDNYNCCCNGSEYSTYYSYATVTSSNTSVATATYNNGVITVKGVGTGTATLTLTASLRQFSSSTKTMEVTVTAKSSSGSSSSGSSSSGSSSSGSSSSGSSTSGSSSSGSSSSGTGSSGHSSSGSSTSGSSSSGSSSSESSSSVSVTQVDGTEDTDSGDGGTEESTEDTEEEAEDAQEEAQEDEISVIESDKGTIWFVPITGLLQGKTQFEQIMGQETCFVDFQMKDASDNVLYAWEFCGTDVNAAEDMIFTIESSTDPFEDCSYGSSSDSLYLAFAQEDDFVGNTSVFIKVDEYFSEGDLLNLYQYDEEADEVTLLEEGLELENGYVTMNLEADEGGELILSTQTLENIVTEDAGSAEEDDISVEEVTDSNDSSSSHKGVIAAVIIIIVILAVLACILVLRKKRKGGEAEGPASAEDWENVENPELNEETEDVETPESAAGSEESEEPGEPDVQDADGHTGENDR